MRVFVVVFQRGGDGYDFLLDELPNRTDNQFRWAGYVIERESRAFNEDVAYGLVLLVEMAKRFDLPSC